MSQANAKISFKNVLKFLPSVSIYLFISIKISSPHEGNLRAGSIENSVTQFFLWLAETFGSMCVPRWGNMDLLILFRNNEQNHVVELFAKHIKLFSFRKY